MKSRKTLVRLHKWQVDEKRKRLSDMLSLRDNFLLRLQSMQETVAREQGFVNSVAGTDGDVGFAYGAFAQAVIQQRENLERSLAILAEQIHEAELAVAEAFKSLKRQEIAVANHERQEKQIRERREQTASDDRAIESHMRKAIRR